MSPPLALAMCVCLLAGLSDSLGASQKTDRHERAYVSSSHRPFRLSTSCQRADIILNTVLKYLQSTSSAPLLAGEPSQGKMPVKFTKEVSTHLFKYVRTIDIKFNRKSRSASRRRKVVVESSRCLCVLSVRWENKICSRSVSASPSGTIQGC